MADEKILSYKDVVLRRSDLDILSRPHFLNDRVIEFYFSYLSSTYPSEDILLVAPSIAFWIKECPDPSMLKDFVEPLHLSQRKLIIFPINDNGDVNMAEGGNHWSLLAFERETNMFVHHDSLEGMNSADARRVYRTVVSHTESDATYVECPNMPVQVNGYDCGLYVTAIAGVICHWYASKDMKDGKEQELWFSAIKEITSNYVSKMRKDILELVKSLMIK